MDDLALRPWLWPDREHGKRASRKLREEHNHAVNAGHALYEALKGAEELLSSSDVAHFFTKQGEQARYHAALRETRKALGDARKSYTAD